MGAFWGLMGLLLVGAIVVAPIWMLIALKGLRARFEEEAQYRALEMERVERELRRLREASVGADKPAASDPADHPVARPAAPARPLEARPVAVNQGPGGEADFTMRPAPPPTAVPVQPPTLRPLPQPAPAPQRPVPPPPVVAAIDPVRVAPRPESAIARVLQDAWNWLTVSEAHRRPGVSREEAVASRGLIVLGVLVLLFFVGFFLKYSIEKGLLGPQARVAMCFVAGAALIAGGLKMFGQRYQILGQGLVAIGLATLYFAVYAAAGLFKLVPQPTGFMLMAGVTLTAGVLAIRYHTVLLAVLGTLGGYLTPVMLATGTRNDLWLFGYLLLLALGVTGVAWRKRWPALTYLSFACQYLVFFTAIGWTFKGCDFAITMPFYAAYFMVYTTALFIHGATHDESASALELTGLFLTAAIFFGGGYQFVRASFDKAAVAWVTLGMAAYYTVHVVFFLRRAVRDRARLATFLGLAAGSLALTLPLLLSEAWLTMAWAMLALVALWVSITLDSVFLRGLALALYGFVLVKLGVLDLAHTYDGAAAAGSYWPGLLDRTVQFGVPVVSFWLAFRLLARVPLPASSAAGQPRRGAWGVLVLVAMYGMLFAVLNLEAYRFCAWAWQPFRLTALTLVWVGFGLHLLARRDRLSPALLAPLAAAALCGLGLKLLFDFDDWDPDASLCAYRAGYRNWGGVLRLADVGMVVAWLALAWQMWRRIDAVRGWALAAGYTALSLLFIHLTFETGSFFARYMPGFRGGAVSVCWALYAFALIMSGLRWRVRALRYLGLGLFVVVVAKVFLSDLDHLQSVYRIAAFGVLGVVLLLAAFVYLKQPRVKGKAERESI
jgi:hypothetical protein